ncbi:MAG: SpoIID/LytB domain-containing protein [Candidatus Gastranaerophilales bacterium]
MVRRFVILLALFFIANPSYAIKIGLQTDVEKTMVGTSVKGKIIDANTNKTVYDLGEMKGYEIKAHNNLMAIKIDGTYYEIDSDNVVIKPMEEGFVSTKGKWYRGILHLQNKNGKLVMINDLSLEDYLKGVLPCEMPPSWEKEALKAQAIAARSYALANLGKRAKFGYDLMDTTSDQAYGGASAETEQTNFAVKDTERIVLTYNMQVINAYYSASAGGKTRTSVWGNNLPYLRSVPSFDDEVAKKGHGVGMSQHGANNLAKKGYNAYQILEYFYNDVKFARANPEYYK